MLVGPQINHTTTMKRSFLTLVTAISFHFTQHM